MTQLTERDGAAPVPAKSRRIPGPHTRNYRLASSIRLPWGVGLVVLLLLALASALFLGRSPSGTLKVPAAALDYQAGISETAAQSVRRSLNEGVHDLATAAQILGATTPVSPTDLSAALLALHANHDRFSSLYVVSENGNIEASVGSPFGATLLDDRSFEQADIEEAVHQPDQSLIVQMFVPISRVGQQAHAMVGVYDLQILSSSLAGALPGDAWVMDANGRVVATASASSSVSSPGPAVQSVLASALSGRTGAKTVGDSPENQDVLGYAPVRGEGPAASLRWAVVTSRRVDTLPLPELQAKREGLLFAVLLIVVTLSVFGWLYAVVLSPILAVQREAERLAYGDLSQAVEVARYDEIGLLARALERLRIGLIRRRVQAERRPED